MSKRYTMRNVRLAFPALFEAKAFNGEGKPAFSASFLIRPDDPQVDELNALADEVVAEKWGAKAEQMLVALRGQDKLFIHNGDMKAQYDGFEGNFYVNARSYTQVTVADNDKTPLTAQAGKPYAGCYVDCSIEVYAQDNKFGKRINASLRWVQFRRDGDAFAGGAPVDASEIDDLSTEDKGGAADLV